jgi:SpoVK/Ycf46/Vps4 family AAA+-type ATPase
LQDFEKALTFVQPSVSKATIAEFEKWQKEKSNP